LKFVVADPLGVICAVPVQSAFCVYVPVTGSSEIGMTFVTALAGFSAPFLDFICET